MSSNYVDHVTKTSNREISKTEVREVQVVSELIVVVQRTLQRP